MKRLIAVAAVLALTACAETGNEPMEPNFSVGGNPHWINGQTGCGGSSTVANCWLKAAGLANGSTLTANVTVDATVSITCRNPAGHTVPGWTGRTRVGAGSGSFGPATKNGQITGAINNIALGYSGPSGCPNGQWTVQQLITNASWTLNGNVNGSPLPPRSGTF